MDELKKIHVAACDAPVTSLVFTRHVSHVKPDQPIFDIFDLRHHGWTRSYRRPPITRHIAEKKELHISMQDPKDIQDISRPSKEIIDKLYQHVSSATAAGDLNKMGVSNAFIQGPTPYTPGKKIVGPAATLQFMPKRDDVYADGEYTDPELQLHRHALYGT